MFGKLFAGAVMLGALAAPAAAAITIDGNYDGDYGAATASVVYDPGAPTSNFGSPTNANHAAAYDIFLTSDGTNVYGFLQADRVTGLAFANLYFDLDYATRSGSDLGFEVGNKRAFVPENGSNAVLADIEFAISADGMGFEFSIPTTYFTGPIAGLNYNPAVTFPTGSVRLNLSQSFGYSVAGGSADYGADRLGIVTIAAVPEPATWAMMIGGFGLVGGAMRVRRRDNIAVAA